MLKKAGAVAIAVAGLGLLGAPAFGAPVYGPDQFAPNAIDDPYQDDPYEGDDDDEAEEHDQMGLLNFGNDADAISDISAACNLDVNVLAVPILQGNDAEEGVQLCANSDDDDNDEHEDDEHDDLDED